MLTVYVPGDSSARSVGSDLVAGVFAEASDSVLVVRNGSRGMHWLEPLVEVETDRGRVGYGPVTPSAAIAVRDALLAGETHPLCIGLVEDLPWMRSQTRLTFSRVGVIDPLDPDAFIEHGGLLGLKAALDMPADDIVAEIDRSGLRWRGGAGFPAGIKWRTVSEAVAQQKYVVVNADEGDSGTFADRSLMEGDPFTILEGMVIAGIAVGATMGYVYIRSEYPRAIRSVHAAVEIATRLGWLGADVLGSGRAFDVRIRSGAGAYICGEETAMLESLEGKRGVVRAKPPLPAIQGLFGEPTLIHNVLTIAAACPILHQGAEAYAALGTERSRGTQVFQLAGNVACGGFLEVSFGVTLDELVHTLGGGTRSGRPVRAVQLGGPLGAYLSVEDLTVAMAYESVAAVGGMLGHGGVVVFDDTVDMWEQARFAMEFCAEESCGKCTPCRIGSIRGVEVLDRMRTEDDSGDGTALLLDLCEVMAEGSLCAMGGLTPQPVLSALRKYPEDFVPRFEGEV